MNYKYISLTVAAVVLLTACGNGGGSSSSTPNDGEGSIDLKAYFPNTSMSKLFITKIDDGDTKNEKHHVKKITVDGNTLTYKEKEAVIKKVLFTDKNITITELSEESNKTKTRTMFREVDLGDTIFSKKINFTENRTLGTLTTKLNHVCKIKSKEKKFTKDDNSYAEDLLKIECIEKGTLVYNIKQDVLDDGVARDLNGTYDIYDTSYYYLKKDLGEVAYVNDDCIVHETLVKVIDDRTASKSCVKTKYNYEFYLDNI